MVKTETCPENCGKEPSILYVIYTFEYSYK